MYSESDLSKFAPHSRQPVQTNGQSTHTEKSSEKRKTSVKALSPQGTELTSSETKEGHCSPGVHSSSISVDTTAVGGTSSIESSNKDSLEHEHALENVSVPDTDKTDTTDATPHTEHNGVKNGTKDQDTLQEANGVDESCQQTNISNLSCQNASREPRHSYHPADTILRSAQGYLVRMEKMSDVPNIDERENSNEVGMEAKSENYKPSPQHEGNGQSPHEVEIVSFDRS